MRLLVALFVACVTATAFAGQAHASTYTFQLIAEDGPAIGTVNGQPAINNNGTVVFSARSTPSIVTDIYYGAGGSLTKIVDISGSFSSLQQQRLAINDSEQVAFEATKDGVRGVHR